ncbi:nucleobindin-2 [Condylostylus longicornis]|uniref:nucleobindin-2 n=1 Tax=Condylostylus longicornis TaxID=2530218 RepID=UPI00244E4E75|nr:nucleobindin-2 [Condylostylus longicornis]XP_055376914.1 nucleobindin-2 [Condylostylus longicornis]
MVELIKITAICVLLIGSVLCLPVQQVKKSEEEHQNETSADDIESVLEYERYLKEVVQALESDQEFRKKLDKAPEADIRSGKIAQELEYVSHHVRSKLDEIKRKELERLRALATKQFELSNDIDRNHLKVPEHVDHRNEHTFEIEDLRKLIFKTTQDLAEVDKQRREEFKQYEMQKEFEKQSVLNELEEEDRKKYEEEIRKQKEKHDKHEKIHHPGNRAQLEEVWEKQDHMEGVDFDPKTFFMMHDVDSNRVWDQNELKALFVRELDKLYQSGLPEDDMRERAEEMERMREHVFAQTDTNRDGLISFEEFLAQTKKSEFQKDPEWDTVDKVPQFTHEEYLEFERRRQEEIQRLIAQGQLPPHPNLPHGYHPRPYPQGQPPINQGYQQGHPQQMQIPQPVQFNPNQQYVVQNQPQQFAQPNQQFAQPNQQFAQPNQQFVQQNPQFPQQGQQQYPQQNQQFNQPQAQQQGQQFAQQYNPNAGQQPQQQNQQPQQQQNQQPSSQQNQQPQQQQYKQPPQQQNQQPQQQQYQQPPQQQPQYQSPPQQPQQNQQAGRQN